MQLIVRNIALSVITALCFHINLYSQLNQVDKTGKKQGKWMKYFANSEDVRYMGQFKDDKPVGQFTYYFPSGAVRSIITHDAKSSRVEAIFYYEDKTLAETGIYQGEKKDSVWVHYTPYGELSFKETYKDGELNGEKTIYYKSEVSNDPSILLILRKANYKNGRLEGPFIEYFPDGVVKAKGQYKEGSLDGVVTRYNPNGTEMMLERWKNRGKHGWWITFDESGKEVGRKYFLRNESLEGEKLKEYLMELKEKGISPNE